VQKGREENPAPLQGTEGAVPQVVTGRNRKKEANKKAPGKKPGALRYEIVD
jgi:hypothetical protein